MDKARAQELLYQARQLYVTSDDTEMLAAFNYAIRAIDVLQRVEQIYEQWHKIFPITINTKSHHAMHNIGEELKK